MWTGADAIELGLVDELGNLDDAIAYAADKANLTDYSFKYYPKQKDLMEMLTSGNMPEPYTKSLIKNRLGKNYKYLETVENISKVDGIQALMPFMIVE